MRVDRIASEIDTHKQQSTVTFVTPSDHLDANETAPRRDELLCRQSTGLQIGQDLASEAVRLCQIFRIAAIIGCERPFCTESTGLNDTQNNGRRPETTGRNGTHH